MKIALATLAAGAIAFAGGWVAHEETQSSCYVLPGYTEPASSNSFLRDSHEARVNPPRLVCK
jgi:hypothetical protein